MLELYGTKGCPYTRELRESLDLDGEAYVEYDVEEDEAALRRMIALTGGRTVPVLVSDGKVLMIGVQGRGCIVAAPESAGGREA
ncbi:MAG: glutathione S-transferase N-terminal domain-containing protein [Hydrogenibacillus schlegelii]|nr:glutathione S-transferase N-terminal domain-containing protein [Hydrogenibacillus schlegelii]